MTSLITPTRNSIAAALCLPVLAWASENGTHSEEVSKQTIEATLRAEFKDETITVEQTDSAPNRKDCALVVDGLVQKGELGNAFVRMRCKSTSSSLPFYVVAHGKFLRSISRPQIAEQKKFIRQGTRVTGVLVRGKTRIAMPVITLQTCAVGGRLRVTTLDRKRIFEGRLTSESEVQLQ